MTTDKTPTRTDMPIADRHDGDFIESFFNLADDGHDGAFIAEDGATCYCRGTLIRTPKGEVPIEDLRIGDKVMTHWGAARPIRWVGKRSYNARFAAGNRDVMPVRIKAGALADGVPRRDLFVSPSHAMFLDGVLIPAFALINGNSIVQIEPAGRIDYFHLELDSHDVIVAEGTLSESFVDNDSRDAFHNAAEYYRLYPGAIRRPAEYCAPIVDDGEALETVRRRIAARIRRTSTFSKAA